MLSTSTLNAGRRRVFDSVFAPATLEARPPFASGLDHDQIPIASFQSDVSSSTIKTDTFASPFEQATNTSLDPASWNRAWTTATAFLIVPDRGFTPVFESRQTDGSEVLKGWNRLSPPNKETADALSYLTAAAQHTNASKDLFEWYGDEIRRHFLTNFRDGLYQVRESIAFCDTLNRY